MAMAIDACIAGSERAIEDLIAEAFDSLGKDAESEWEHLVNVGGAEAIYNAAGLNLLQRRLMELDQRGYEDKEIIEILTDEFKLPRRPLPPTLRTWRFRARQKLKRTEGRLRGNGAHA
jgi:hypothetical protein